MFANIDTVRASELFIQLAPYYSSLYSSPARFFFSYPVPDPSAHPGEHRGWWASLAPVSDGFLLHTACGVRSSGGIWLDRRLSPGEAQEVNGLHEDFLSRLEAICHQQGWPLIRQG
jgi:Transcriptional regulator Crl.